MPPTPTLLGMDLAELGAVAAALGLPPYGARQLADWVYRKGVREAAAMTNLPRTAREALAARHATGLRAPLRAAESADGTRKYLFPAGAGLAVETAVIPDGDRATLCVSTQVGCRRACRFCATGRQGWQADLSAGEILNQYAALPERDRITNLVFMGMGEPLDNLEATLRAVALLSADYAWAMSPTRVTVSTVGILPALERLLAETSCHVALSVHSPFPEERRKMVPAEASHPLAGSLAALRRAGIGGQRRLMVEYIPFAGVNDSPRHAQALAALLRGLPCRVNLIPYNSVPDAPLQGAARPAIERFQRELLRLGLRTHIRRSRGADIAAACGMLSTAAGAHPPLPPSSPEGGPGPAGQRP